MEVVEESREGDTDDDDGVVDVADALEDFEDEDDAEEAGKREDAAQTAENKFAAVDHVCSMCGKSFDHAANLKMHIQSHLGSKALLKSCDTCKRYIFIPIFLPGTDNQIRNPIFHRFIEFSPFFGV